MGTFLGGRGDSSGLLSKNQCPTTSGDARKEMDLDWDFESLLLLCSGGARTPPRMAGHRDTYFSITPTVQSSHHLHHQTPAHCRGAAPQEHPNPPPHWNWGQGFSFFPPCARSLAAVKGLLERQPRERCQGACCTQHPPGPGGRWWVKGSPAQLGLCGLRFPPPEPVLPDCMKGGGRWD